MKPIIIKNKFSSQAGALRKYFEKNFEIHKDVRNERFVWDYWYVKDQYQFLRTPAYHYFPQTIYHKFHSQLVQWGREFLGCHDISPSWLSYYVEGMEQKIHSDVPHGPWAWVFSISPRKINFSGGETFILRPETLNYWQNFVEEEGRERNSYIEHIKPDFNKLIVFDPRMPHGVTPVKGTADPLEGRVVIHGWFVEPRPYVVGSLSTAQVQKALHPALLDLSKILNEFQNFHGTQSFRIQVAARGQVTKFEWLTDTIVSLSHNETEKQQMRKWVHSRFSNIEFQKTAAASKITIPLLFR